MTLQRYLSRLLLGRMLMVLLGLAALLQLLDLFDRASEVLAHGGMADIARYTLLRLPTLLGQLIPLAVLVGAILTFRRLAGMLEITALRAAGVGAWHLLRALVPACVIAMGLQLALHLGVVPRSERALADWWDGRSNSGGAVATAPRLWLRTGRDILSVEAVSLDGRRLEGVLLIRRDAEGRAVLQVDARHATHGPQGWLLEDARIARPGIPQTMAAQTFTWPEGPPPLRLREASRPTEAQTLGQIFAGLRGEGVVTHGSAFYATRVQALLAVFATPALMLLLSLPAAFGLPRQDGAGWRAVAGLVLGLGYLVTGGLLTALGEAGALPPAIAVWTAPACFAIAGFWLLWREEF